MAWRPRYELFPVFLIVYWLPTCLAFAGEKAVFNVILNTVEKGTMFVILDSGGDVFLDTEFLKELGIDEKTIQENSGSMDSGFLSLRALHPLVTYSINHDNSTISLFSDPRLLKKQIVDVGRSDRTKPQTVYEDSGFFNYDIRYRSQIDRISKTINFPVEIGGTISRFFLFSSFSYDYTETGSNRDTNFLRRSTEARKDDVEDLRTYILGDYNVSFDQLSGSGEFGGVSFSKNYRIAPYLVKTPSVSISDAIQSPAEVKLYVDGNIINQSKMGPGPVEFVNLPYQSGYTKASLHIKDSSRTERIVIKEYYASPNLLKPGLHEYSYNLGFKRISSDEELFRYSGFAFAGFHRYGFRDDFTAGIRAEASDNTVNLGGTGIFLLGLWGEVQSSFALSRSGKDSGFGGLLQYAYFRHPFSMNISFLGSTKNYANISLAPADDKTKFGERISMGISTKRFGSISGFYTKDTRYIEPTTTRFGLAYNIPFFNGFANLSVLADRVKSDQTTDTITATVSVFPWNMTSVILDYSREGKKESETLEIVRSTPLGPGYGYKLSGTRAKDEAGDLKKEFETSVVLKGAHGTYGARYANQATDTYELAIAGGVAFIDREFFLTRPITDGYVLLELENLDDIKVDVNSNNIGKTDRKGKLLIPNVNSYSSNRISFDLTDIPVNIGLTSQEKNISTYYRSGGKVKIGAKKIRSFSGNVFFMEKGGKKAVESAGLEIDVNGKKWESVVGRGGEFYLENLPPGKHPANAILVDKVCEFSLVVPDSEDEIINLGEIICEIR